MKPRSYPGRIPPVRSSTAPAALNPLPTNAPDPVRAVSLGLALLRTARVESWDDLNPALRDDGSAVTERLAGVDLNGSHLAMLDSHLGLMSLIRVVPASRGRGGHIVTVAAAGGCSAPVRCPAGAGSPSAAPARPSRPCRRNTRNPLPGRPTRHVPDQVLIPAAAHILGMAAQPKPHDRLVVPRRGPIRHPKSGAGPHAQGTGRRRTRGDQRRATITEQRDPWGS